MQQMQSIWMMLHTKSPLKMWVMICFLMKNEHLNVYFYPNRRVKTLLTTKDAYFTEKKESYILKQTKCTKKAQF